MRTTLLLAALAVSAALQATPTNAQDPDSVSMTTRRPRLVVPGRSMVSTTLGIVASSQPLAARAGVQILEQGGNAVDAAIAANAVVGLMEPGSAGIGGDLFAIVYTAKDGKLYGLNSS